MRYLIDTNVLSELRKKQPDANVVAWMKERPRQSLFLSVLTLGEIRKGVEQLPDSARKLSLLDWLTVELPNYFVGRLLPVDADVADQWGHLSAKAGRPLPAVDALLAATALQHRLTLVTRNTRDFEGLGVDLLNPWETHSSPPQPKK
ncbi:type II toxin-antitoxin system VapC family toxin [Ottowia testudinis]|uniref:Ribonuclease VapC n=1 Tax=Ottowia testudinis TaxID=2816950 RepID=A0A975H386_9BURK|nr:type II toxin-antitoxin system VapC family toxin [Ottowia testudinis]QTD44971.1 type II toxin-antitoxin system VapC family toxin [Ottowia testudinis]